MSATATASAAASASASSSSIAAVRWKVSGSQHGPDAPARLALADRGERLADRGRVVAVVVVDGHAGALALALQPTADAGERGEAGDDRRRGHAEDRSQRRPPPGRWPRCAGRRSRAARSADRRAGRGRGSRASSTSRSAADDPPEQRGRRAGGRREPLGDRPRVAAEPLGRLVDAARRRRPSRASRPRRPTTRLHARVGDVGDERRARRARAGATPRTRRSTGGPVGEHVRVVPLGAGQDRDVGPVRVEVAGVLVGLDDEGRARSPSARWPVARRSGSTAAGRRRTPTDPRRLRSGRGRASRPSCSCRACRRRRRGSDRRPRRRRPAATARAGSRASGPRPAPAGPDRSR